MSRQITSWSYSRYSLYKECPAKAKYKFLDKLPEPPAPAMERGIQIHKLAEDFTLGKLPKLPKELNLFKDQFKELKKSKPGVEEMWCFKKDWSETRWDDWNNVWLRIKTDAYCVDEDVLYIIDNKTGKNRGGYEEQMSLYPVGGFLKFPHVTTIHTQLWFLDSGDVVDKEYKAKDLKSLQVGWEKKVKPMLSDTRFAPKPGNHCRWCAFSKAKGGPCKF